MIAFALLLAAATATTAPQPIDIRSETLTVEHGSRRATFGGGVVATRGELEMACPQVEATYDRGGQVREVVCVGAIQATEGDRQMQAGEGRFDNATGLLTLRGEPTLTEGERTLTGEILTWDADEQIARLEKVRGQIPAAEAPDLPGAAGQGPLQVQAARVVHETEARRTTFEGGVVATRGNLVVRAERLTAHYDEAGDLERAVTSGGQVQVTQGARRGQADRATFTGGGQTLVLTGNPKITEGASVLEGEKATFLLGHDRVVIDRPRASFPLRAAGGER